MVVASRGDDNVNHLYEVLRPENAESVDGTSTSGEKTHKEEGKEMNASFLTQTTQTEEAELTADAEAEKSTHETSSHAVTHAHSLTHNYSCSGLGALTGTPTGPVRTTPTRRELTSKSVCSPQ